MFGRLFKKKEKKKDFSDEIWTKVLKIMELANLEITQLKKEVEVINAKLRSKFFKKEDKSKDRADTETNSADEGDKQPVDDGFDELRTLRKSL